MSLYRSCSPDFRESSRIIIFHPGLCKLYKIILPIYSLFSKLYKMRCTIAFIACIVAISDVATAFKTDGDPEKGNEGLKKICTHLKTQDKGCVRYTRGYDVTGVLTTITPNVNDECACIEECIKAPGSCDTYVWKYNDEGTRRTCTLYSNFNLPSNVTVVYDEPPTPPNQGYDPIAGGPTQVGGLVPKATKAGGEIDEGAVSGPVWQLEGGETQC
jgi:hypothetical protein